MIHLLIPEPTPDDIINIIAAHLEDMSKQGIHTSPTSYNKRSHSKA
jgi:hypothetical protein